MLLIVYSHTPPALQIRYTNEILVFSEFSSSWYIPFLCVSCIHELGLIFCSCVLSFQFLEVLLLPNLLLLSLAPVIQSTYHIHHLWFLWLEYKNIKLLLSSNCPGQHLCTKILTLSDHSCTSGKFYWAQVLMLSSSIQKKVCLDCQENLDENGNMCLVSVLSQSIEAIIPKNEVSEQLNKYAVTLEKSQDDFVKWKTVLKICCSYLQSSRWCGWGRF